MIEIPNPESVEEVADWVELMLATQGNQLSKADVSSAIERTSGVEASEVFISGVWRELEYRSNLYFYDFFTLHERSVEPQPIAKDRSDYLICLILSLFGVQGKTQLPGKLFERITREVVENYLDGEAVVFGWPFEKIDGDEETAIKQKVRQLAGDLSEKFYETPASRFKDRGLDIVGWTPHYDKRSSQVILLIQCAAGHNWNDKLPVPLDAWCQYIHWASNPIKAFAVPCVISERDWHDVSKDKGILFDRIRIMNLLLGGIEDAELKEAVDDWIRAELENYAE